MKNAIKRYNEEPKKLGDPDVPSLSWEQISEFAFIGEFNLLCIGRSDIPSEKWAQAAYQEASTKHFKLCCTREELDRLNMEICRLWTFIQEETKHTEEVIEQLPMDDPLLAAELHHQWILRSAINGLHLQQLKRLQHEPYDTGSWDIGEGMGSQSSIFHIGDTTLEQEEQIEAENEQERDFEFATNFIEQIVD